MQGNCLVVVSELMAPWENNSILLAFIKGAWEPEMKKQHEAASVMIPIKYSWLGVRWKLNLTAKTTRVLSEIS